MPPSGPVPYRPCKPASSGLKNAPGLMLCSGFPIRAQQCPSTEHTPPSCLESSAANKRAVIFSSDWLSQWLSSAVRLHSLLFPSGWTAELRVTMAGAVEWRNCLSIRGRPSGVERIRNKVRSDGRFPTASRSTLFQKPIHNVGPVHY